SFNPQWLHHTPVVPVGYYWKNNRFYQGHCLVKQLYRATSCRNNVPAICAWTWLSDQLWIYQLESMGESKTKPSICCESHGWRI
ncbi:hypothetical protein DDZ16_20470, partial [Marinilabilia rubra]